MDIRISQYILESGIGLLVFYGIYYFLLRKETFFQLNRAYLMMTAIVSILIPLVHFSLPVAEAAAGTPVWEKPLIESGYLPELVQQWNDTEPIVWEPLEATQPAPGFTLGQILWLIYALGIVVMSFRFLQKFSLLSRLIRSSKKFRKKGYTLVSTDQLQASSFLGYIFWHEDQTNDDMILQHELVHIRQRHSLDVIFMEFLVILFWFNPLVYWYRSSIKEVHEYIADQVVARQNSPYAYACLLVQSQQKTRPPQLFNTFHSFIKKRLLMLQNQPSSNWQLMKYLITMPVLAALIIFFTLDFSEKLPGQITEPVEKATERLLLLDQITVVGYPNKQGDKSLEQEGATTYQILWEGKTCDCYPESEKTPNYFRCEGFSLTKSKLAESKSFKLLKNGEPLPFNKLWVRSNGTFKLGPGPIQMQELNNYEEGRSFYKAVPIGYTLRFNFDAGKEAGFYFHAFVNNEQNSLRLTHTAQIGEHRIEIDPMVNLGKYTLDYTTYQKMLNEPIQLIMNNGEKRRAMAMKVGIGYRYHTTLQGKRTYRLKDFASSRWMATPGDRVSIYYYLDDDETQEFNISLNIEQDKDWHKKPKRNVIFWDKKVVLDPANIYLEGEQLEELHGKKMEFIVNGRKYKVKHIESVAPDLINGPVEKPSVYNHRIPGQRFQEMLDLGLSHLQEGGGRFYLTGVELENGLVYNGIRFYRINDFDPAFLYKDPASAKFTKEERKIALENPQSLDMKKLESLRMTGFTKPLLVINGNYISSSTMSSEVFNKLQLNQTDKVTIYLPGASPKKVEVQVPVGYIEIQKDDFNAARYRTNVIKMD